MDMPEPLRTRLQNLLPGAALSVQLPPKTPALKLWLLDDIMPMMPLDGDTASALMDEPPYWSFCWASGQVLAAWILAHPEQVRGCCVVDVGSGSGVVAIAAALAGARRVIACDQDPDARQACAENARLNGVSLEYVGALDDCLADAELITAADILYDRDNLPLLARMRMAARVLLADSRVPDLNAPGYQPLLRDEATTWPDLDESKQYNLVRLFGTDIQI